MSSVSGGTVIKSIQRGVATNANAGVNVTISAVDMDKTMVSWCGTKDGSSGGNVRLTSSTNLFIIASPNAADTAWEVIEYD